MPAMRLRFSSGFDAHLLETSDVGRLALRFQSSRLAFTGSSSESSASVRPHLLIAIESRRPSARPAATRASVSSSAPRATKRDFAQR